MGFFDKPEVISPGSDNLRLVELERRVAQLEAQVARLTQPGFPPAPTAAPAAPSAAEQAWLADVRALAARGKKIEAIKVYRERTGVTLKEAKDAVDAMPG